MPSSAAMPRAQASVGPSSGSAALGWWAVWDREAGALHERTRHSWRGVTVEPGRAEVRQHGVAIELALTPAGEPVRAGAGVWTRKTPLVVRGDVRVGDRRLH